MANNKGFTLLEVMTATAIAIPLLIIMMQMVPGMMKSGTGSEANTISTFLAESKVNDIRRRIRNNLYATNYTSTAAAFASPYQLYKSSVTDDLGSSQKQIAVVVWKDADSNNQIGTQEYSFQLNTIVAKR